MKLRDLKMLPYPPLTGPLRGSPPNRRCGKCEKIPRGGARLDPMHWRRGFGWVCRACKAGPSLPALEAELRRTGGAR